MKAYISCPLSEHWSKVLEVQKYLVDLGYEVTKFHRGEVYEDTMLKESDIFVLISQNNQFDFSEKYMSAGCKKELDIAADMQKPLYLAYWKSDTTLKIYHISEGQLMSGRVIGLSGRYIQSASFINNQFPIY